MEEKTYSVYVHKVETDNGPMYYAGVSGNINKRWKPSHYKQGLFGRYVKKYGWDNIEHIVAADGLTYSKSRQVEDNLILFYSSIGKCLNSQRSGLVKASDRCAYYRRYNSESGRMRKYYRKPGVRDRRLQYEREKLTTPEGRIYNRVASWNRRHPERVTETPMEAKRKYLETGYIPAYIKNDDL